MSFSISMHCYQCLWVLHSLTYGILLSSNIFSSFSPETTEEVVQYYRMKTRVETRFLAWIVNRHLLPVHSNWILFNPECSQIMHNTSWYRTVLWGPQWCSGLQNGDLEHGAWVRVPAPPFSKCGYGAYDHGLLTLLSGKKTLYLGGLLLKIKHNTKTTKKKKHNTRKGLESGWHRTRQILQLNT